MDERVWVRILSGLQKIFLNVEKKVPKKFYNPNKMYYFYINTVWSYGQKQKYRVEHYGYIFRDIEEEFETYSEAAKFLLDKIKEMVKILEVE